MGKYEKELILKLKDLDDIPTEVNYYNYCLTHTYDMKPRRFYVAAPYKPDVFEAICAYIQFECAEIEMSYSMEQTEVIEVLEKFYDCIKTKRIKAHQVDLYLNWEYFCGSDVQSVECLKREGMNEYFQKYVDKYLKAIEEGKL